MLCVVLARENKILGGQDFEQKAVNEPHANCLHKSQRVVRKGGHMIFLGAFMRPKSFSVASMPAQCHIHIFKFSSNNGIAMGASAGENGHWQFELAPAVAGSKGVEEETAAAGPAHAAGSPKQQSFYDKPKGKKGETWQGAWSLVAADFSCMVPHQ
jgi:hypothetical protein